MTNQNKGLKHNEPMRIRRNCAWSTSSEGKRVWPRRSWFSMRVIDVRAVCGVISLNPSQSMMKQRRCSLATLSTVSWKFFKFQMPLLIWQMELTEHFFDRTPSKRLWLPSLRVAGAIPGHISSNQSTYYRALLQHVGTGCEVSLRVLTL